MTSTPVPSIWVRLWIYQSERFPLFKTALLVFFFTAATLCFSATVAGRKLPDWSTFAGVWLCVFIIFFQMRVADEFKDFEIDARYRPERAVPRGLISLRVLANIAIGLTLLVIVLTSLMSLKLLLPLVVVWIWLGLMSAEFFVPQWITSRPLIYLVSHMAIMPLIDFYVSAAEWLVPADKPGMGLWLFYGLSFFNGCVLEFGRKIWAPDNEREGVETYSATYGPTKAIGAWATTCTIAAALLLCVGYYSGTLLWIIAPTILALIAILKLAFDFSRQPTPALQKWIDNVSGLWIVLAYGLAGFVPLWVGQ